jgi:ribosomal protein L11 methyltransferase
VDVHFVPPLDAGALRTLIASALGRRTARALRIAAIAPRDWTTASLAALAPVRAGRFVVHGAHDRARVAPNRIGIEIEAALAFGTGHHGTTRGCLLALDALAKKRRYLRSQGRVKSALDLGTGTGLLAIAAAKTFRTHVLATDSDARAVRIARANARKNRAGALVETLHAAGFNASRLAGRARFDLVLANILLQPLQRLAAPMARRLKPRAHVVLSGLLPEHANAAISAYRAHALALERRITLDNWVTLVLVRRPPPRPFRNGARSMHRR